MEEPRHLDEFVAGRPHWWQWLTILSLDAPLVAVAWQRAIVELAGARRDAAPTLVLGSSVWLAYTADRWIEGWRLEPGNVRTQRHWFHRRWRTPVAVIWLTVLAATITLSFTRLTARELEAGLILLLPVGVYLFSHQLVHRRNRWRAPKEICVALLFVGGVACFPSAEHTSAISVVLGPLALFGLLCFADCALISNWENEVDLSHGQTSLAIQFPGGRGYLRLLPWAVAVAAIATAPSAGRAGAVHYGAAASGILLGLLDLFHRRLGRQLSRVLIDFALMTPFVFTLGIPP
ncbi:MAG TPA: hypothetical protein VGM73_15480 [Candidatus Didemnitutus sp.]|jgi:hypothetical protein